MARAAASFLAKNADPSTVYWSEPYEDWTTKQTLSSAASPIVFNGNLVGVAALDLPPRVLSATFEDDEKLPQLTAQLQLRSRECNTQKLNLQPCKFQMLWFGPDATQPGKTCPAELSDAATCCFVAQSDKKFRVVEMPLAWEDAKTWCQDTGGKLAVVGDSEDEDLHLLAGIAPPHGAWIGLARTGDAWGFVGGVAVSSTDVRLWSLGEPQSDSTYNAAFVNPRGSTANIQSFKKAAKMSFICEYATACSTLNCSRAQPTGSNAKNDFNVKTARTCQFSTETFILACSGNTDVDKPTCAPKSNQPWGSASVTGRSPGLCCGTDPALVEAEKEGGDTISSGVIAGAVAGAAVGMLIAIAVWCKCCRGSSSVRPDKVPDRPPAINPMGGAQPAHIPMQSGLSASRPPMPPPPPYYPPQQPPAYGQQSYAQPPPPPYQP